MATNDVTTDTVLERVGVQHDRLFDVLALIEGAVKVVHEKDGERIVRMAYQMLDDITDQLDCVVLVAPGQAEVAHG